MKTDNTSDAARAFKRLESVKSFYSHLAIWATLNVLLLIGHQFIDGLHPDFWEASFAIMFVLGGLGVLGHFMGVFGFRIFFSEEHEKKILKLAFNEIGSNNGKINPGMENTTVTEQFRVERARRRVKALKGFYKHLAAYIVVNAALLISSYYKVEYLHNETHEFWSFQTFSTAIFWGIGLLCHAFNTFGMGVLLGKGWEERKIKDYLDKQDSTRHTSKWE